MNETENSNLKLALTREVCAEIGTRERVDQLVIKKEIFTRTLRGRGDPHKQVFYLAHVQGDLRTEDKLEDEGDEWLTPPMWYPVHQLQNTIFHTHRAPLVAGMMELSKDLPYIVDDYANLLFGG